MHDGLTVSDGLYNPLLLGAVNDTEDLATNAMDFSPGMRLNTLRDSGNGFGVVQRLGGSGMSQICPRSERRLHEYSPSRGRI